MRILGRRLCALSSIGTLGDSDARLFFADITKNPLPKVDLIVCRDCLIHLSVEDARMASKIFNVPGAQTSCDNVSLTRSLNVHDFEPADKNAMSEGIRE